MQTLKIIESFISTTTTKPSEKQVWSRFSTSKNFTCATKTIISCWGMEKQIKDQEIKIKDLEDWRSRSCQEYSLRMFLIDQTWIFFILGAAITLKILISALTDRSRCDMFSKKAVKEVIFSQKKKKKSRTSNESEAASLFNPTSIHATSNSRKVQGKPSSTERVNLDFLSSD